MAPSSSSSSSAATSVQVALRIRPPTQQDNTSIPARFQRPVIHAASSTSVEVEMTPSATAGPGAPAAAAAGNAKKQYFTFDQVHGPSTTQHQMYTTTAEPLITRFVDGFNCTVLAYGQTSSGKTFTMTGMDLDADPTDPSNGMGIIPRSVSGIFSRARQLKEDRGGAWTFNVKGSFIEIYNEDLIDLLGVDDGSGGRREVQIREDKAGHIIWGGLREVNVKSPSEVMSLIRQGTSLRRTNETSMNAQSSRSHAIFSLTLTQKKYTGSGPPPRSSSPLPPHGRSPSRLARPGSMYQGGSGSGTRVSSPTFGRPATPSFASAIGRGGGLRPSSALGHAGDRSMQGGDEDAGEWVTIVSKFHFVDLAGSERLKRTAAAGERIKEGISINGGLLALGNVISALGDPTRSKATTHVPYRDSKLTRLLQDSLGGNSHTLMIACVSPAEYNANETVNTLKYANRARNIKNRAIVNTKEDGWDDVEWLQTTVGRLRKELKALKEGGVIEPEARNPDAVQGVGKKVLAQMSDLQNNYETLREKFVERTEELTRLRGELGESHRDGMSVTGTGKYEEIVGPVIEEYEKTISTMEAELSLNRVALSHTNELVAEKEQELAAVTERHSATELYVEELRARVAKLSEREASTEAYVRDLEEKMKSYDETSITSSESMGDLRREVTRFRDVESHSTKYIADLEARLAKSDESILSLQQTVERLEKECESRRDAAEALQNRLDTLRQDSESWRTDLEQRESRVRALEEQMIQWERKMQDAGDARQRLGSVVSEVESARRGLDPDITPTNESTDNELSPVGERAPSLRRLSQSSSRSDVAVERQFSDLQETHQATLADLASVTNKYRDALREISDLAAQIQEAKLSGQASTESPTVDKFFSESTSPARRRMAAMRRETSEPQPQYNAAGRRLFFRQAASTESLHSRSLSQSQSLSQELSSVHSRKASFSSYGSAGSHSPSNSQSVFGSRPNLSISLPSTTPGPASERSAVSLEKEIMRLQEVLKERENEITLLETTLRESRDSKANGFHVNGVSENGHIEESQDITLSPKTIGTFNSLRTAMESNGNHVSSNGSSTPTDSDQADESLERLNELMLSMAQKESSHREVVNDLSTQLAQVRKQFDDLTVVSRDQTANMSAEMDALRGRHEDDLLKLDSFQKREAELVESLRAAETEHTTAIEAMRVEHEKAMKDKEQELDNAMSRMTEEHNTALASVREELATLSATLAQAKEDHENAFGKLQREHAETLASKLREADDVLAQTRREHEVAFSTLRTEQEDLLKEQEERHSSALHETEEQYYNALTKLRRDHAEALEARSAESLASIERLKESHAAELKMAEIAKEGTLSESQSSRDLALQELQEAHADAIAQKEASYKLEATSLRAEHERALESQQGDFKLLMDKMRNEHEGVLKRLREELKAEHNASFAEKTKEHSQLLETAKSEHGEAFSKLTSDFETERTRLLSEHEAQVKSVSESALKAQADLDAALRETKEQHAVLLQDIVKGHEEELSQLKASHSEALLALKAESDQVAAALASSHSTELDRLRDEGTSHKQQLDDFNKVKEEHLAQLQSLKTESDDAIASMLKSHTEESLKLKAGHEASLARLEETIVAMRLEHTQALESSQEEARQTLQEEKSRLQGTLEALTRDHAAECETLRKDRDLLSREFESHKATYEQTHEQALQGHSSIVRELEDKLGTSDQERDDLAAEVKRLREELDSTKGAQNKLVQEASKRESLTMELERHRSVLAELQESLQKVKDEKDVLQTEKAKSDALARDLQAQLARNTPIPVARPTPERVMSHQRPTALKLPPPTPPPSVPPPPAPRHNTGEAGMSMSSQTSSAMTASTSARDSVMPDSPSTSVFSPITTSPSVDAKRLEQQAKKIEEQETMIKTLNKQLTHCESDLQTHMDLVSTLETSLGDSEKNLRKARMHATELARERDGLNSQVEALRNEVQTSKQEVDNVRRSIVVEKQSYEQRLDEERKAKDRARQQLDSRMEELQKRKSKFACL